MSSPGNILMGEQYNNAIGDYVSQLGKSETLRVRRYSGQCYGQSGTFAGR
jgi:hypothetical protein